MSIESAPILSRDSKGKLRHWRYEIDGARWRGISGLVDGKETAQGWTVCKAKNVGRANATTPEEQAALEAEAELRKKLDREYRRTEAELDDVPLPPMLAQKFKDRTTKNFKFAPDHISVQPKLDGIRMFARPTGGLSRDYQPFGQSVAHIFEELEPVFKAFPGLLLDGELYNHHFKDDFNSISSLVRTQNLDADQLERSRSFLQYHIYDVPSAKCLTDGDDGFNYRHNVLAEIAERFDFALSSSLVVVPTFRIDSLEEGMDKRQEFLERGYEGMMWRQNLPYEHGVRSWSLLKDKDFVDMEVEVTRVETGVGNWEGIPKALEFIMPPDDHRTAQGERPKAQIKGDMDVCRTLVGRNITGATIRYFALTPDGVPRFPVAVDLTFDGQPRKD